MQLDEISFEMSSVRVIEGNYHPTEVEDFLNSKFFFQRIEPIFWGGSACPNLDSWGSQTTLLLWTGGILQTTPFSFSI